MGYIILEKDRLILETNSDKRHQQGKKLLSKHLDDNFRFQETLIESPDQKLKLKALLTSMNKNQKALTLSHVLTNKC